MLVDENGQVRGASRSNLVLQCILGHSREMFSGELRFPMWISEYYHESIYSD